MEIIGAVEKARFEASTDEEIVDRVKAGDTGLYEIIMRRYNQRLYRVARAILHDDAEAEDVMQDAYVRAYQHLDQFAGRAAFSMPLPGEPLIDWGGTVRWYAASLDPATVRAAAEAAGGTALCWRGSAPQGRFHPLTPPVAELHRRLKARFDPAGIFNPGRLLAGL